MGFTANRLDPSRLHGSSRGYAAGMQAASSENPGVHLRCLACEGAVELAGYSASCPCGLSIAQPDGDGYSYGGPAKPSLVMLVHAPDEKAMVYRETQIADTASLHRAEIQPLI